MRRLIDDGVFAGWVVLPQEQGLLQVFDQVPFCMEFLKYAVRPDRRERLAWDFYILCLVVYSSVQGPYTAAFVGEQTMHFTDIVVDLSFYCDIVLNFWTGFDKGFEVIMEKKEIVKNYLGGWFFIDFIATINWDLVITAVGEGDSNSPLVRLLRLLKVLRLARASRLINRLTASWTLHTAFIEAAKFFFYVFMVGHLLACFFFMWPTLMECRRLPQDVAVPMPGFFGPDGLAGAPTGSTDDWNVLAETFMSTVDLGGPDLSDVDLASGEGWYYASTCMQGSWRQAYGLQKICALKATDGSMLYEPFDSDASDRILKECYLAAARDSKAKVVRDGGEFRIAEVCQPCMDAGRLYTDAMYWSLTTMTTIGYGDRGPKTEEELSFTIVAEVVGLSIFALLLTQINTLNEVIGESAAKQNDQKNGVVQFLKNHHLSDTLVEDTVRFLNFRASSLSGHAFAAEADEFSMLSPGLIEAIQNAVYRPVLERVRFFGWNKDDEAENQMVKVMFDDIDTDGGGSLDKAEVGALFKKLQIGLTEEQYDQVFQELDGEQNGSISFDEFLSWWFLKKNGKPRMVKCPSKFLDMLCTKLNTEPFAIREEMVHTGDYGKSLIIILSGTVRVYRDTSEYPVDMDPELRPAIMTETVSSSDREPIIGFASCLSNEQWKKVSNRTSDWVVVAETYVDTAWVARPDIISCFESCWPKGQWQMVEVAKFHYEVDVDDEENGEEAENQPVELQGDFSTRLDTLNTEMCERIANVERKMEQKLDVIIELLQGNGIVAAPG